MSAQLLKNQTQQELPTIDNSRWQIYHLDNATMCKLADNFVWVFGVSKEVHDEPSVWKGTWEKIDGYKIKITAITISNKAETIFELIFVTPNVFIGLLNGNVKYSGIRK